MNVQSIEQYLDEVIRNPHPCEHGHVNCAAREGGMCSDEVLSRLEERDRAAALDAMVRDGHA